MRNFESLVFRKCFEILVLLILFFSEISFAAFKFSGNKATLGLSRPNSKLILSESLTNFGGTLKLRSSTGENIKTSSSKTISFAGGAIQMGASVIDLSGGTYNPQSGGVDTIVLNDGDVFSVSLGTLVEHDISVADGAVAEIVGTPNFSGSISVGTGGTLKLGIQHKLTQNVDLAVGAKLMLSDDLDLKDEVVISGNDNFVDLQNYTLEIGASGNSAWTGVLNFQRAGNIKLNALVKLNGTWKFVTDALDNKSVVNGNGNILDLSGGGIISVGAGHTLYLSDVYIKGLGDNAGRFSLDDTASSPGSIVLSNVTIDLSDNYTHSAGVIQIYGDNVRFIVGKVGGGQPYTFTIDSDASGMTSVGDMFKIDGQVLIYETLGGDNVNPFYKKVGGVVSELLSEEVAVNGGVIRSAISDVVPVDIEIDTVTNNSSVVNLTRGYELFTNSANPGQPPTGRIVLTNSDLPNSKSVVVDGGGYVWQFPSAGAKVLKVEDNISASFQNVVLKDFTPSNLEIGSGSSVDFSNGTVIELNQDLVLSGGINTIVTKGGLTVKGNGQTITVTVPNAIENKGIVAGGLLIIENATIKLENAFGISVSSDASGTGDLVLKNCNVIIDQNGWTLGTGSLDFYGYNQIFSRVTNAVGGITNFKLSTKGKVTINSGSTLRVNRGVNVQYEFDSNSDLNPSVDRRSHLVFSDPSATLYLDGCMFTTTGLPITFSKGNLIIDNSVQLNADTTGVLGEETEIGTAMNVEILAGGSFDIDGNVKYISTFI